MKRLIIVMIAAAVALAGCKTREVVVTEHHTDTLRLTQHHRDSIYLHDSTFVREYIHGDTVRIVTEMWHTKYRDRLKTDTLYRSRTDSVPVPYPVIKEVKKHCSDDYANCHQPPMSAASLFCCRDNESKDRCGKHYAGAKTHNGVVPFVRKLLDSESQD